MMDQSPRLNNPASVYAIPQKAPAYQYALFYFLAICLLMVGTVEPASANVLNNLANAVLNVLNNTFLRVIAIIAVIIVGLSALSGRMEWSKAGWIIGGVVIIFGAAGIVDYIIANAGTV